MAHSSIKLYYFAIRGRGELGRLLLAAGGKKYEDIRFKDQDDWVKNYKPISPYGQSPFIDIDGKKYAQSVAISTYLAKEFNLYSKDNREALRIDEVVQLVQDLFLVLFKGYFEQDPAEKAKLTKKLKEEDLPRFLNIFEKLLKDTKSGYFVGKALTLADVAVYDVLETPIRQNPSLLSSYPELASNRKNVASNPGIADYLKKRPDADI